MSRRKGPPAPAAPRAGVLARWSLAAAATLAALAAAEGLARLRFRRSVEALAFTEQDLYYYQDPSGVRRHIPNKVGYERMWNGEGKAEFRINSLGLRGGEIVLPKPAGVLRVLALGDSITLGGRLRQEDTYVERLGALLNVSAANGIPAARQRRSGSALDRAGPSGGAPLRYEVVNAGVGDVGLLEEEETLRGSGALVEPDLVVLFWYLNDARPPVGFPEETIYAHPLVRAFHASPLGKSHLAGLAYEALRHSLVARQVRALDGASRRFQWAAPYNEGRWTKDPAAFEELVRAARFDWGDAWDDSSLRRMAERIAVMRGFVKGRGAGFAVVMLPVHAQIYASGGDARFVDRPQAGMRALLAEAGIPALDLLPAIRARSREPVFYDQCHYTPRGNEIVAAAVADWLSSQGLLSLSSAKPR